MMKTIRLLSLGAGLWVTTASAQTLLYGSVRTSLDYVDAPDGEESLDLRNNSSRLGFIGTENLGNGLTAEYRYEFGVDSTEGDNLTPSQRPSYVGLRGDFGTLRVGTQWTVYALVADVNDVFNNVRSIIGWYLGPFRFSNGLFYRSPRYRGALWGETLLTLDGAAGQQSVDTWQAAVHYHTGGLVSGVAYLKDETRNHRQWVAAAGYRTGAWLITGMTERVDDPAPGRDAYNLYGTVNYSFGPNIARAGYAEVHRDQAASDVRAYNLGLQHNFSKRSWLWLELLGVDPQTGEAQHTVSVGMRHDF